MNPRLDATTGIWRARQIRATGESAYVAYAVAMFALIVGAPTLRAIWVALKVPTMAAALASPRTALIAAIVELGILAAALILGRNRGPAVAPPFVAYALTASDMPNRTTFGARIALSVVILGVAGAGVGGFVGALTATAGFVPWLAAAGLTVRGLMLGTVISMCWLLGEALPRVAGIGALGLALVAALLAAVGTGGGGAVKPFVTWAWVSTTFDIAGTVAVSSLAILAVLTKPLLLDTIASGTIATQSGRWDTAIAHAVSLDFGAAADSYQALPSAGRRIRAAFLGGGPVVLVVVRDAIGSIRTPRRFLTAIATVTCAGLVLLFAAQDGAPAALLGAVAGGLMYAAIGAFSQGLQHVARGARDQPLYGLSGGALLLLHCIFPFVLTGFLSAMAAVAAHALVGPAFSSAHAWEGIALSATVIAARLSNTLRGSAPLFLMTPAPSAIGDPMPLLRVLWALDAPLLAVLAGAAAATSSAALLVVIIIVLAAFLLVRWARRT